MMLEGADSLPAKRFISHAYADAAASDAFIERLPSRVAPFVFPPITVKPDEFVGDPLINAVLDCDGLIYLRGGASDHSFWRFFEAVHVRWKCHPALRQTSPDVCVELCQFASST